MSAYLIRRLLQMIPTLLGVVLLVFFLFTYVGGDPATILAGKIPSAAKIQAIREQLGLDQPVWVQLWIFIQQIVTFDFGRSWSTNEAVSAMLLQRAPVSLNSSTNCSSASMSGTCTLIGWEASPVVRYTSATDDWSRSTLWNAS